MDAIFQEIRNDPCDVLELQFVWAKVSAKSQGAAVKGAETRDIFNLCMDKIRRQPMWGSTEEGLVLQRDDNCKSVPKTPTMLVNNRSSLLSSYLFPVGTPVRIGHWNHLAP